MSSQKILVRIVQMEFQEDKIALFLANFNSVKEKIRNSKGCRLLELYRDKEQKQLFFTYSYWETKADLENYRASEVFRDVWAKTKPLFSAKPKAWSVEKIHQLN